jgi:hypothetical protein
MKSGFLMSIGFKLFKIMRMKIFSFQMAVKSFLKRNTINFLNYALILRRSVALSSQNLGDIQERRPLIWKHQDFSIVNCLSLRQCY